MVEKMDNKATVSVADDADSTSRARRALLKRAVVSMPAILTLQSGAALARSSNIIKASQPADAVDPLRRMLCLDYRYVDRVQRQGKWADLGDPVGRVHVQAITDKAYYDAPDGEAVGRSVICAEGGSYTFVDSLGAPQETAPVSQGMLVSATALSSFASFVDITEI